MCNIEVWWVGNIIRSWCRIVAKATGNVVVPTFRARRNTESTSFGLNTRSALWFILPYIFLLLVLSLDTFCGCWREFGKGPSIFCCYDFIFQISYFCTWWSWFQVTVMLLSVPDFFKVNTFIRSIFMHFWFSRRRRNKRLRSGQLIKSILLAFHYDAVIWYIFYHFISSLHSHLLHRFFCFSFWIPLLKWFIVWCLFFSHAV